MANSSNQKQTRIVIVDDDNFFLELIAKSLSGATGIEIVGTASDGEAAVLLAESVSPDVAIMDIELPGNLDGIDAAAEIKKNRPETGILLLSSHVDKRYLTSSSLTESIGWSYLMKQSIPDVVALVRAFEGCAAGMVTLDPAIVSSLQPKQDSLVGTLTERQFEVMGLIAQGLQNRAIAEHLNLSLKSIETYITGIYQHLQLTEEGIHGRVRATLVYLKETDQMRQS